MTSSLSDSSEDACEIKGPRIGMYYGIIIDQDSLTPKIDPLDIAAIIEGVVGISPYDPYAMWRLDYDKSLNYRTIVIYHTDYTQRCRCTGYSGGWHSNITQKPIPSSVSQVLNKIIKEVENIVQGVMSEKSFAMVGIGYGVAYFAE